VGVAVHLPGQRGEAADRALRLEQELAVAAPERGEVAEGLTPRLRSVPVRHEVLAVVPQPGVAPQDLRDLSGGCDRGILVRDRNGGGSKGREHRGDPCDHDHRRHAPAVSAAEQATSARGPHVRACHEHHLIGRLSASGPSSQGSAHARSPVAGRTSPATVQKPPGTRPCHRHRLGFMLNDAQGAPDVSHRSREPVDDNWL
jgi:hypothetical protein